MRASFDSDASLGNSPPSSPPRHGHPVYFVQSPSRESTLDVDSLSQSFSRATPRESPHASPLHKHFKQASTDSTTFSTAPPPKPGSRRILPQPSYGVGAAPNPKKGYRYCVGPFWNSAPLWALKLVGCIGFLLITPCKACLNLQS